MATLTILRTPLVTRTVRGAARRLYVSLEGSFCLPAIENADDPDKIPAGDRTLVMTRMASRRRRALWLPDSELFVHAANVPDQLRGCVAPGLASTPAGVRRSAPAMASIFDALGGWEEGREVEAVVLESEIAPL